VLEKSFCWYFQTATYIFMTSLRIKVPKNFLVARIFKRPNTYL